MATLVSSQLQEGLYVTRELFLDEKYILLSPEIPVDEGLVNRLNKWGFDYLHTEGDISSDAPAIGGTVATAESAPLAAIDQGRRDTREMQDAIKQYNDLLHFVEQLFASFLQKSVLPINPIHARMKQLVEQVRDLKRYLLRIPELDPGDTSYIVDHGVKTAIVAIAAAATLKTPPHRLIDLGTVAVLHEIGMVRLPSELYMSERELTEREKKALSTVPVLGFKILRQFNYPMQICLGVLECREHVDGSGYPRALTGDKISSYAKFCCAASAFAAMASARPYRPPIDGHTTMKTLLTGQNTKYDKEVLQGLVGAFSLFPYGTYVQLASGHRAVVVDVVPGKARSPQVRIITDSAGSVVREQPLVDTDSEQYAISGVLEATEVARLRAAT